jgi:hypothetical protein
MNHYWLQSGLFLLLFFIFLPCISLADPLPVYTHDITVVEMLSPGEGSRMPVNVATPVTVRFENTGTSDEANVNLYLTVKNYQGTVVYRDTVVLNDWLSGQTRDTTFGNFTPTQTGSYQFCAIAALSSDESHSNDTLCSNTYVGYEANIKAIAVVDPQLDEEKPQKLAFQPMGTFQAIGIREHYDVKARVQIRRVPENSLVYQADSLIPELLPGDPPSEFKFPSKYGTFDIRKLPAGYYKLAVMSLLPDDGDRTDDTAFTNFYITATKLAHDITADSILAPKNGTNITDPYTIPFIARFHNNGTSAETNVKVFGVIRDPRGNVIYRDTVTIASVAHDESTDISFRTFVFSKTKNSFGDHSFSAYSSFAAEQYTLDDTVRSVVSLGYKWDIQTVSLIEPSQGQEEQQGIPFSAKASFKTNWTTASPITNVPIRCRIYRAVLNTLASQFDTVIASISADSAAQIVVFPSAQGSYNTASLAPGDYYAIVFNRFSSDGNRANDTVKNSFTVRSTKTYNITADSVLQPIDRSDVYKTTPVLVRFSNTGIYALTDVTLFASITDTSGTIVYQDNITEKNWKTGEIRDVAFKDFAIPSDGFYKIQAYSMLGLDVAREDDTVTSVFYQGIRLDASAIRITYPLEGASIYEHAAYNPIAVFQWTGGFDDKRDVPVKLEIRNCTSDSLVYEADSVLAKLGLADGGKECIFPSKSGSYDVAKIPQGCYRVKAIANMFYDGNSANDTAFSNFTVIPPSGVNDKAAGAGFSLSQNHPNPFSSESEIEFSLPEEGIVSLRVYDVTGRLLITKVQGVPLEVGEHTVTIHSGDLPNGLYTYELVFMSHGGKTERLVKNMTVIK